MPLRIRLRLMRIRDSKLQIPKLLEFENMKFEIPSEARIHAL